MPRSNAFDTNAGRVKRSKAIAMATTDRARSHRTEHRSRCVARACVVPLSNQKRCLLIAVDYEPSINPLRNSGLTALPPAISKARCARSSVRSASFGCDDHPNEPPAHGRFYHVEQETARRPRFVLHVGGRSVTRCRSGRRTRVFLVVLAPIAVASSIWSRYASQSVRAKRGGAIFFRLFRTLSGWAAGRDPRSEIESLPQNASRCGTLALDI